MFKFALLLLVALGAALYFPSTRPWVMEQAAPIIDPVLSWSTRNEMNEIARDLAQTERATRRLPEPREQFPGWLRNEYVEYQGNDATLDGWGTPYGLIIWPDSFAITSSGPDEVAGTEDDLHVSNERSYPGG